MKVLLRCQMSPFQKLNFVFPIVTASLNALSKYSFFSCNLRLLWLPQFVQNFQDIWETLVDERNPQDPYIISVRSPHK